MTTDQRHPFSTSNRPRLGISACLLGEPVRYDGGHKRHLFLSEVLADFVDFIPVCPEAGSGMGVPRPPIQLAGQPGRERAIDVDDPSLDYTDRLKDYALQKRSALQGISGYIFKSGSPSCGLGSAKRLDLSDGAISETGTGIYAHTFLLDHPLLPVAEEHSFDSAIRCDRFLAAVWIYWKWQSLVASDLRQDALRLFHKDCRAVMETRCARALPTLDGATQQLNDETLSPAAESYILTLMTVLNERDLPNHIPRACPYPQALRSRLTKALS